MDFSGKCADFRLCCFNLNPRIRWKVFKAFKKSCFLGKACNTISRLVSHCATTPHQNLFIIGCHCRVRGLGFKEIAFRINSIEDEGVLSGNINADNAVSELVRQDWFKRTETALAAIPESERVLTGILARSMDVVDSYFKKPNAERVRTSFEIAEALRPRLKEIVGPDVQLVDNRNSTGDDS